MGYYVYRGTQTGGPYAKLNATPISLTTYTDSAVQAGQAYFYVATSVDSNNVESSFSNETSAIIPTP
jgi:fibronectin type 3 domain-containing protein